MYPSVYISENELDNKLPGNRLTNETAVPSDHSVFSFNVTLFGNSGGGQRGVSLSLALAVWPRPLL